MIVLLSIVMMTSMIGCSAKSEVEDSKVEAVLAVEEYETVEAAKEATGYEFETPSMLGDSYNLSKIRVIESRLVELTYSSDDHQVIFRVDRGSEDVSGDYTVYEQTRTIELNGIEVICKGDKENDYLATWADEHYSYSLMAREGLPSESFESMIPLQREASAQMIYQVESFDDIAQAEEKIGFTIRQLTDLPEGYSLVSVSIIMDDLLDIRYSNGSDEFSLRASLGDEDNSGVYTEYASVTHLEINGSKVTLKGNDTLISLALYQDNGISYSLYSENGMPKDSIQKIIEQ